MGGILRAEVEEREARELAPVAMRSAVSRGRDHACSDDPHRTAFQRDRDRIVHARAFRRLAHKTQVFIAFEGDLNRSRLTHTLEVAQLARSAARRLGLNEDLVECVSLVHDLGHPPFGHRGEALLAELMEGWGGFEHNRQTLRIVEELERRYPGLLGLNLTYEVREAIVKHGTPAAVPARFRPTEAPLIEAQLVDGVDSIAYDCHDLDDGLRAGLIRIEDLQALALWRGAWDAAVGGSPTATPGKVLIDQALRVLVDALMGDLIDETARRIAAAGLHDLAGVRAHAAPLVGHSASTAAAKRELEDLLTVRVYRDWRVNRSFHKAQRILSDLFGFLTAHPDALPDEHRERIEAAGLHRAVADYIAGMTDRFAVEEHARLFEPGVRAW